jgi:hypothetical protein
MTLSVVFGSNKTSIHHGRRASRGPFLFVYLNSHKEARMLQKALAGAALLVVLVGCRDGPTTPELPVEPETPVTTQSIAQPDVLLTVREMLDDPLVLEIVEALGDQTVTYGFDDIRDELHRQTVHADVLAMHRTLTATRDFLAGETEGADIVLRDVLRLVLDDAEMMLVGEAEVAQPEDAEGDRVKHSDRVKH